MTDFELRLYRLNVVDFSHDKNVVLLIQKYRLT